MRAFLLLVLLGCEPSLAHKPLPELVRQAPMSAISVPMLMLVPGEQWTWSIQAKGFTIARADLAVEEHEGQTMVRSRLETGKLVSAFARVRHELATVVDRSSARVATEVVEIDGETSRSTIEFRGTGYLSGGKAGTIPDGNVGHTLHSALGLIRAWASPDARAGFVYVVEDNSVYRIDLARPFVEDMRGKRTLRVDCRIRGDVQASVTIWLSAGDDRTPLRFEIGADDVHLTAELLETDA